MHDFKTGYCKVASSLLKLDKNFVPLPDTNLKYLAILTILYNGKKHVSKRGKRKITRGAKTVTSRNTEFFFSPRAMTSAFT